MASKYIFRQFITNDYLGVSKEIKAQTGWELNLKIEEQERKWAEQVKRKREREHVLNLKEQAEKMDANAQNNVEQYRNLLVEALRVSNTVDWDMMMRTDEYKAFQFTELTPIREDVYKQYRVPKPSFFEKIFESKKVLRLKKEAEAQSVFERQFKQYEERKFQANELYNAEKEVFETEKKKSNDDVITWKNQFEEGECSAVERYLGVILANSHYPDAIMAESEVSYDRHSKTAVVLFRLPIPDDLPQNIGYKFIASRKAIEPILMKATEKKTYYENVIQQIALRTIYELFEGAYVKDILDSVVFNGWVQSVDKATGQDFEACILSVQASQEEFEKINLERISPKECLHSLKAISAGPLQNLAPVKPIMDLDREDRRFVDSIDVLDGLESETNLAMIPWAEFEHLIRELFSRIFSSDGSEVKVTQASRDGGVDAIAFDPDPIRGGKFVIQAKRYNNVVPVSACRDLYGTMIAEGATKGLLVTTSYYGNDSREFVKDKPITLIDGANLVHMFNEHGYNFRINLKQK